MILMLAPAAAMVFTLSTNSVYTADSAGIIKVTNNSVADQAALLAAGCLNLNATMDAYERLQPTTGFSHTVPDNTGSLIIKPAGTLATGTIIMPANPIDGQPLTIASSKIITALTHNANTAQTLLAPLTTITANGFGKWKYILSDLTWYRTG